MDAFQADAASQSSEQVDAARFLRSFFDAIARRDWPTVAISVHANASFFILDPDRDAFSIVPWERAAGAFREWMERSMIARKFAYVPDKLALQVTGESVIVTPQGGGPRVMVLTFEDGRWQIHHLHLSRLGIPITALDIDFSFRGMALPNPRTVAARRD